jgi:AsmA-like C-terminal region
MAGGLVLIVLCLAGGRYIDAHWPYRYRNVEPLLQKVFASQIKVDHYHRTYFPRPGFVATGLTLRRYSAPDLPPIGSAESLVVQGSWADLLLLRNRVSLVDVERLHVVIPPVGSRANHEDFPPGSSVDFSGPATVVEQLNIRNATLDIMRVNGSRYSFPIQQLVIRNLRKGEAISYFVDMQNAWPSGHILANGSFGPLLPSNLGATPVSGSFTFTSVKLEDIHGLSGGLSSAGRFYGALAAIEADTTCKTPDFAVGKGKPTQLAASTHATINGLNANMILHTVDVHTGATAVHAEGDIVGSPKITNLDISVANGRAQDILRPFFKREVPIAGAVWLHSHARLTPAGEGLTFLKRLQMDGVFDIPSERLTNRGTEQKLSDFSQRAQGAKPTKQQQPAPGDPVAGGTAEVFSSLNGRAKIRDGIVSTQHLYFEVPGADVDVIGIFSLHDGRVHMLGDVSMQSDISHAATGVKSMLLKPLIPFFKKHNAGAKIPIAITGSPNQYKVTEDILHNK